MSQATEPSSPAGVLQRQDLLVLGGLSLLLLALFTPLLLAERVLAPGDGLLQSLPGFLARRSLWTPLEGSGFPIGADPQAMLWYPVAVLFVALGRAFNAFVISAYLLTAWLQYCFVRCIGGERLGSAVAALVLSLGGFFAGHIGHTNMIHAAAWAPLLLLALELMRRGPQTRAVGLGAVAVACGALAGHPHMLVKMLCLGGIYAVVRALGGPGEAGARARVGYLARAAASVMLGLGMAAILVLPMIDLASRCDREHSFEFFVQGSFPLWQLPTLVFPRLCGGWATPGSTTPYFGDWYISDLSGTVGTMALVLALAALVHHLRRGARRRIDAATDPSRLLRLETLLWGAVAVTALVLALGKATPLARLMYELPVLSSFRSPSRYLLEMSLALSTLAGLGVTTLAGLERRLRLRVLGVAAVLTVLIVAAALLAVVGHAGTFRQAALERIGVDSLDLSLANPALGVPLLLLAIGLAALVVWARRPTSLRAGMMVAVLLLELAHSSWWLSASSFPSRTEALAVPAAIQEVAAELESTGQRYAPLDGGNQPLEAGPPNLSMLHEVASASAYNPLMPRRYAETLSMRRWGGFLPSVLDPGHVGLDIVAVRYLMVPRARREAMTPGAGSARDTDRLIAHGLEWSREDLGISLGAGCGPASSEPVTFEIGDRPATVLAVVSHLACSGQVADGAPVLSLEVETDQGTVIPLMLRAGEHTAEWAWDRPDMRGRTAHRRAPVFSSERREYEGTPFPAHRYLARFETGRPITVRRIRLVPQLEAGAITVSRLTLADPERGAAFVLDRSCIGPRRFRLVRELEQTDIWENLRALPRIWAVDEALALSDEEILRAIRTSNLPGGRRFNPRRTALVECEPADLPLIRAPGAQVRVGSIRVDEDRMRFEVSAPAPALVVIADQHAPGWRASVDGRAARLRRVDRVLRGIGVDAGEHDVVLTYRPWRFVVGLALSALAAALTACCLVPWRRRSGPDRARPTGQTRGPTR